MKIHQKRLITIFDEKPDIVLFDNDVIITNNASYTESNHRVFYISSSDNLDKNVTLVQSIQEMLSMLPGEYQVVNNSIYHMVLRPIVHVLAMLERVIQQEQINEIWLFGGSEQVFFTLSHAEGEGTKRLYHSSWLFNPIVNEYFSENKSLKIVWKKKKIYFSHAMLYWFREHYNYYRRALGYMGRKLLEGKDHIPIENSNKKIAILLADLELQYKHLAKVTEGITSYEKLFILGRKINPAPEDVVCQLPSLSVLSTLEILKEIRKARSPKKWIGFQLNGHVIKICAKQIMLGSTERLFIALYQEKALSRLIQSIGPENIQCVCTNRTMGADICYVQNVCKEHELLHVNFQYVAMQEILYPNMNVADRYYLYSRNVFELYKDYGKQFKYYLPLDKQCFTERNDQAHRIVIFTQPDAYTDRYLSAIKAILRCFQDNKSQIEIIIKLHYRQDKIADFVSCERYYSHTKVLTKGNAGEVMNTCDCVISMTSSVLFEALLKGIPTIILDFDGLDEPLIKESGVCVPEVNYVVHSPQEVLELINNYSEFWREYRKRLEVYLGNNYAQYYVADELFEAVQM